MDEMTLSKSAAGQDPFALFKKWFAEYKSSSCLSEPNGMVLSTVGEDGQPHLRTVLLKQLEDLNFIFYTNYTSQKAKDILLNNKVCILFPWYELQRQVIVRGQVERVSKQVSQEYFTSRDRGSQIGAWASKQSHSLASREEFEGRYKEQEQLFKGKEVPLPDFWGGYKLTPTYFEFWQGRPSRLHDRVIFLKNDENKTWQVSRIYP